MAVDVEALKALGLSDQEIAQIAAIESGGFQPITATPQAVTNPVAGAYDYTPLYGGGDIIPGLTSGIFEKLGLENPNVPVFRLLGSENKGGTNVNESMNFAAIPGQSYRLVNNATGEVLGEASTPEDISGLVAQSNALSKQLGKKADLSFETSTPEVFGGGYSPIFKDQPNILFDTPMKLIAAGMLAATGAGLLQPGGLGGVGAAGTSGAAGGTGLGAGTSLASQGLASLPANLAAIQSGANAAIAGAGLGAGAAGGGLLAAAAPSIFEAAPIVVTAGGSNFLLPSIAALTAGGAATAGLTGGAGAGGTSGLKIDQFGNAVDETGAIVATAGGGGSLIPVVGALGAGGATLAATAGGGAPAGATDAAISQSAQNTVDTAYSNAQTGAASDLAGTGAGTGAFVAPGAAATVGGGVLGTGLSLSELATLGSLGASAVGSLFGGGGGGTGTATPYVSPFGAGGLGIGRGMDYRAQPAITDYERYGFGPEASFFRPEYSQLLASAAAPAQPAATTNPVYTPLI